METRTVDNQASYYENFAKFINDNKIPHVALGLLDVESNKPVCDVNKDSLFVKHFLMKLQVGVKISAHPYDGFGYPEEPTKYKQWSGLDAVVHYMADMNNLLKSLGSHVLFNGMVLGESMGGRPFKNDVPTVKLFRQKLAGVGLSNCTLGASPGGPDLGLDEFYKQVYDWTSYGSENPNFWITYKNDPQSFFKALEDPKVHRGWDTDQPPPIPPWSEMKYDYNDNNHLWKWQIPEPGKGLHWMWARSVPEGDHKRLIAWTWKGVSDFYTYVKKQISTGGATGKVALYMDDGLQAFW